MNIRKESVTDTKNMDNEGIILINTKMEAVENA